MANTPLSPVVFAAAARSFRDLNIDEEDSEADDDDDESASPTSPPPPGQPAVAFVFLRRAPPTYARNESGDGVNGGRRGRPLHPADVVCSFVRSAAEAAGVFVSEDAGEALTEVMARLPSRTSAPSPTKREANRASPKRVAGSAQTPVLDRPSSAPSFDHDSLAPSGGGSSSVTYHAPVALGRRKGPSPTAEPLVVRHTAVRAAPAAPMYSAYTELNDTGRMLHGLEQRSRARTQPQFHFLRPAYE